MSVALVGTARRTLFALAFFLNEFAGVFRALKLANEVVRTCFEVRAVVDDRDGASPKMKNLMKAPMSKTTESWPINRPCVNVKGISK